MLTKKMFPVMKTAAFCAALLVICINPAHTQENFSAEKIIASLTKTLNDTVFEVVVKKPFDNPYTAQKKEAEGRSGEIIKDNVSYEDELPWDTVDYTFRTDEYYSVGTAFAIGENLFVSAAHVVNLTQKNLTNGIYVRAGGNKVYEIDKILKYSNHEDFVLFSLKNYSGPHKFLKTNRSFEINNTVFAVGNALGQGIVSRNGLLTSTTKESETGAWDWIRFSAAASPGNSGGPLLNEKGEVIGIILRKSEQENLNFALPISILLDSSEKEAKLHYFLSYSLIYSQRKYGPEKFNRTIPLPLNYQDLRNEIVKLTDEYSRSMLAKLISKNKSRTFPNGPGSRDLFYYNSTYDFPNLICENLTDGMWDTFRPKDIVESKLDRNGRLKFGAISGMLLFEFKKPENIGIAPVIKDSKFFMDTFLKGYRLSRNIGGSQIRIKSLGEPESKTFFTDSYKRKWIVETWRIPFADEKILIYSLPVPTGRIGMMFIDSTSLIDSEYAIDSKLYTDFIHYSFSGTFSEWKSFLEQKEYIPALFSKTEFSYNESAVKLDCGVISVNYRNNLIKISDNSFISMKTAVIREKDGFAWDIKGINIFEDKSYSNSFGVVRFIKPEINVSSNFQKTWKDIVGKKHPFNKTAYTDKGDTIIESLHRNYISQSEKSRADMKSIYTIWVTVQGKAADKVINDKLKKADTSINIME